MEGLKLVAVLFVICGFQDLHGMPVDDVTMRPDVADMLTELRQRIQRCMDVAEARCGSDDGVCYGREYGACNQAAVQAELEEGCRRDAADSCADPGCREDYTRRCVSGEAHPGPPFEGASDRAIAAVYAACREEQVQCMADTDVDSCMRECVPRAAPCAQRADTACTALDTEQKTDCMSTFLAACLAELQADDSDSHPTPPAGQSSYDSCLGAASMLCAGLDAGIDKDACMDAQARLCRCLSRASDLLECVSIDFIDADKCIQIIQDCLPGAIGPDGGFGASAGTDGGSGDSSGADVDSIAEARDEALSVLYQVCSVTEDDKCEETAEDDGEFFKCSRESRNTCFEAGFPCATRAGMVCMAMSIDEKKTCLKDNIHECIDVDSGPAASGIDGGSGPVPDSGPLGGSRPVSDSGPIGRPVADPATTNAISGPDLSPALRVMKDMERRTFDSACMLSSALICMPRDLDRGCRAEVERRCRDSVNTFIRQAEMEMWGDNNTMRLPDIPDGDKPGMAWDGRDPGDMGKEMEIGGDNHTMRLPDLDSANTDDDARTDGGDGGHQDMPQAAPPKIVTVGRNSSNIGDMGRQCTLPAGTSSWSCSFNAGFCDTENDTSAQQTWRRGESTPSGGTGPDTVYDGPFIYIETSADAPHNVRNGDIARLMVPVDCDTSDTSTDVCLSMKYNMNGPHMGKLAVITRHSSGEMAESWAMEGHQGPEWHDMQKTLMLVRGDKVYISGQKKDGHQGDAAVDDLRMTLGPC